MNVVERKLSIIILTYNRASELVRTLDQLLALSAKPAILVINNASTDATKQIVEQRYPQVQLINLHRNMGAAARNIGVMLATTPYVAFCDDDSWWENGSLEIAVNILDFFPQLAAVCARILLGQEEREDPISQVMAQSPLPAQGLPGPALLGFVACAVVFRRQAYLAAGGYEEKFFVGGEEELLSLDLIAAGWRIVYSPKLIVHHFPSPYRDNPGRQQIIIRNALWVAWLRLPFKSACHETMRICRSATNKTALRAAVMSALRESRWVWQHRRVLPPNVHRLYRQLRA